MSDSATMMSALERAEVWLKAGLYEPDDAWHSLYVSDEEPHVERVWRSMDDDFRVAIHRIHTCGGRPLFHYHRWPAAFLILSGSYRTGVGYGDPHGKPPDVESVATFRAGDRYPMDESNAWHWVNPVTREALTVMVIGRPYPGVPERPTRTKLGALSPELKRALLEDARRHFRA